MKTHPREPTGKRPSYPPCKGPQEVVGRGLSGGGELKRLLWPQRHVLKRIYLFLTVTLLSPSLVTAPALTRGLRGVGHCAGAATGSPKTYSGVV